jgi:hypothetical protein
VAYDAAGLAALRDAATPARISDIAKADWLAWHELRMGRDWFPAWRGEVERAGPVNRLRYGLPRVGAADDPPPPEAGPGR